MEMITGEATVHSPEWFDSTQGRGLEGRGFAQRRDKVRVFAGHCVRFLNDIRWWLMSQVLASVIDNAVQTVVVPTSYRFKGALTGLIPGFLPGAKRGNPSAPPRYPGMDCRDSDATAGRAGVGAERSRTENRAFDVALFSNDCALGNGKRFRPARA